MGVDKLSINLHQHESVPSPKEGVDKLQEGDVLQFGMEDNPRHYAIYLKGDKVLEVEEWGASPREYTLTDNLNMYEEISAVYREPDSQLAKGGKTNDVPPLSDEQEKLFEHLKNRAPQFRRIYKELRKFNTKNPKASYQEILEFLHEKMSSMEGDFQTNLMELYIISEADKRIQEEEESSNLARGGKTMDDKVSDKIRLLLKEGKPQDQAVAIALSMRDEGKLAKGGKTMTPSDIVAFLTDREVAQKLAEKMMETLESSEYGDKTEEDMVREAMQDIRHSRKMLTEILIYEA
jgi:hypothetical protein